MSKKITSLLLSGIILLPIGISEALSNQFNENPDETSSTNNYNYTVNIKKDDETTTVEVDKAINVIQYLEEKGFNTDAVKSETDLSKIPTINSTINVEFGVSEFKKETKTIPFRKKTENTDELYVGETKIKQKGADGTATVYRDGEELTIMIDKAPVPEITLIGTKERPAPTVNRQSNINRQSNTGGERSQSTSRSSTRNNVQDVTRGSGLTNYTSSKKENSSKTLESISKNNQNKIAENALAQVGKPYVWGAAGPNAMDCSGFIYHVLNTSGYKIPRMTAAEYGRRSQIINSVNDLVPGDILWTNTHIAMYVGKDGNGKHKIVHAANSRTGVVAANADWFLRNGYKIGRLI